MTAVTTLCPECETQVEVDETPTMNEIVECAGCLTELEVVATGPLMLALAPEVEEDWGE